MYSKVPVLTSLKLRTVEKEKLNPFPFFFLFMIAHRKSGYIPFLGFSEVKSQKAPEVAAHL